MTLFTCVCVGSPLEALLFCVDLSFFLFLNHVTPRPTASAPPLTAGADGGGGAHHRQQAVQLRLRRRQDHRQHDLCRSADRREGLLSGEPCHMTSSPPTNQPTWWSIPLLAVVPQMATGKEWRRCHIASPVSSFLKYFNGTYSRNSLVAKLGPHHAALVDHVATVSLPIMPPSVTWCAKIHQPIQTSGDTAAQYRTSFFPGNVLSCLLLWVEFQVKGHILFFSMEEDTVWAFWLQYHQ